MIEQIETMQPDMLEFHISGSVTADDYANVLVPAIDAAIEECEKIRCLLIMDSEVSDFTLGAAADDMRMGMKHWRGFDRLAIVTGSHTVKAMVHAFSMLMPCPVMIFEKGEVDAARRWLSESLGSIHQTNMGNGVLHLQLLGKLDNAVYDRAEENLDAFIRGNDRIRLLVDIREFDGWQGLGAIGDHFKLVREHGPLMDRIAVVGDAGWQKMAADIGRRFIGVETQYFDDEEFDKAKSWLAEN